MVFIPAARALPGVGTIFQCRRCEVRWNRTELGAACWYCRRPGEPYDFAWWKNRAGAYRRSK